ncbi:hypothetical protein NL676_021427 [Syzygium grande]|nr:hypothetical protein NL676_021427 [Syzygium grande]
MDIEKVPEAASAHYVGLTEDRKQTAQRFFEAMDKDKSGNVSIDEFMAFLSHAGYQSDNHYWLFAELDQYDNGTLNFKELVTFFYILSRDEYKNLSNSQPSIDVPHWKIEYFKAVLVNEMGNKQSYCLLGDGSTLVTVLRFKELHGIIMLHKSFVDLSIIQ